MQFLTYLLSSLTIFLALFIGMSLALSAKEELRAGKKYFTLLQDVILLLIITTLFAFYINIYIVYYLAILLIFLLYFNHKKFSEINIKKPYIAYSILAVIFYLSSKKLNLFVIESSLIFLYGLPTGSLLTATRNKKKTAKRILSNTLFVVIALVLFLI